ncbi:het domain-containing protein [Rutstroemia sp. NJR-2017a WRK4]|nr:het domain-containing protein [Rutstroemia sp. NJR-2017a WRK4]
MTNEEDIPLPTRCLEAHPINTEDVPSGPNVRFSLSEKASRCGRYIALSHRWTPAAEAVRTTTENYDCRIGRCGSIEVSCPLSYLFWDVALIAYRLGVKYVWIDSICIIQDDAEDWRRESAKMADYYQNAWLTIAATTTNPYGSLINKVRNQEMPRISRLAYYDTMGKQNGHFYLQCTSTSAINKEYRSDISHSELLTRGWVHQEWMLSRRIMCFSKTETASPETCQGDRAQEPEEDEESRGTESFLDLGFGKKLAMALNCSSENIALKKWEIFVETFSSLGFTKLEQDRLAALAGIAREFGLVLQRLKNKSAENQLMDSSTERYMCGLWYGNIRGLSWEQCQPGPRRRVAGVPTWSWASMSTYTVEANGRESPAGMRVQWDTRAKGYYRLRENEEAELIYKSWWSLFDWRTWARLHMQSVCKTKSSIAIPVDGRSWEPQFQSSLQYYPENFYGNDNRFVSLQMSGRLTLLYLDGYFTSEEDIELAAKMTDHCTDVGRDMWRRVSLLEEREYIDGWASVEHPEYQTDAACVESCPIYAFFLSQLSAMKGGYGTGSWFGYNTVYKVLFLIGVERPGIENCFERVGTGRLFGCRAKTKFDISQESDIWLV